MNDSKEKNPLRETYPANSRVKKLEAAKPEEKKVEKIVTGLVKTQKKSLGKKFAETFLEDDTKSVGRYILQDVLIPAAKALISDMVTGSIEMLLFGERRGNRTTREGGRSYTSYGSFYRLSDRDRPKDRDISKQGRARHEFDEIILETRGEAEQVLSHLVDLTIDYGEASVADLYELVGITSNFTDNKYGWYELKDAFISRVRNGYLINLPKTQILE